MNGKYVNSGVIIANKPEGLTSFEVVKRIKEVTKPQKVGHMGTLDPFATGVLPLAVGKATKLVRFLINKDKEYRGTVKLGEATDTHDLNGEIVEQNPVGDIDPERTKKIAGDFEGMREQTPPMYSAKKLEGRRLYELAREGKEVKREPELVNIYRLEILEVKNDEIEFRMHCSAGAYVRKFAHNFGNRLGCGGHLKKLKRISAGPFSLKDSCSPEEIERNFKEVLIPLSEIPLEFDSVTVDEETRDGVKHGRDFRAEDIDKRREYYCVLDKKKRLIALAEPDGENLLHPSIVLI